MHLEFNNVNDAFYCLCSGFAYNSPPLSQSPWAQTESRNGPVKLIDEPVTLTYRDPLERVLFNPIRDANPFFHLYEAMWMLAGRNDVEPLAYYADNIRSYSDDGLTLNGAYGRRWRRANMMNVATPVIDQLEVLADHLRKAPNTRRAVLSMWNVHYDLLQINTSKDVCCNTHVYFSIDSLNRCLDMTVCNRSNDLIWGLLGANYVHFSFLQEYMAAKIGITVGCYHHFTNNLHWYTEVHPLEKYLEWNEELWPQSWVPTFLFRNRVMFATEEDISQVDEDILRFAEDPCTTRTKSRWFVNVARPAMRAFSYHKESRNYLMALAVAGDIEDPHWRYVCVEWLMKRAKNWYKKQDRDPSGIEEYERELRQITNTSIDQV